MRLVRMQFTQTNFLWFRFLCSDHDDAQRPKIHYGTQHNDHVEERFNGFFVFRNHMVSAQGVLVKELINILKVVFFYYLNLTRSRCLSGRYGPKKTAEFSKGKLYARFVPTQRRINFFSMGNPMTLTKWKTNKKKCFWHKFSLQCSLVNCIMCIGTKKRSNK